MARTSESSCVYKIQWKLVVIDRRAVLDTGLTGCEN